MNTYIEDLDGRDANAGKPLLDALQLRYRGGDGYEKALKRSTRLLVRDMKRTVKQIDKKYPLLTP